MHDIVLTVNGAAVEARVEGATTLADFLRDTLSLTGTHLGCSEGVCGACTVLLDDTPVRACLLLAVQAAERRVRTVESFAEDPALARLQRAFATHNAAQCGFCTPGMLAVAAALVEQGTRHDEAGLRRQLSAVACRCTGYAAIVDAVSEVLDG
jgi:aerobic-type carbon monoxide dehydrogenase small subunit (CoxS/CutS family)